MVGQFSISAKLSRADSLPPCGGGSGWGVVPRGALMCRISPTPTPDPSPAETAYTRVSVTQ